MKSLLIPAVLYVLVAIVELGRVWKEKDLCLIQRG